ncbi:hypothetical protein SAMN05443550_101445 [Pedobacter hartonius]|uniref:Uncharacterized protein n=2 Tax=Pedobacter hartonius TaxID=425514 RepID=A0A1H3WZG7_9SPHI|nr:hypothetical protein SAMN05443550_101445 [Pedobacter hartonius]
MLRKTVDNHLYLHFFDVVWNEQEQQVLPNGLLTVQCPLKGLTVTPVVYITNQSLKNSAPAQMDSLAFKVHRLLSRLTAKQAVVYENIQVDCDWSVDTRAKYFTFLRAFKQITGKKLEATIRLHQVKYPERTGVPPVDKGVLMFYNMGRISADLNARNSIYNYEDAAAYTAALPNYHLPLDIALPLFSWSIQIRAAKVIQLYAKISLQDLSDRQKFEPVYGKAVHVYKALTSFYLKGAYIKKGDLFKFEGMDTASLARAAKQVSEYLAPLENRNIIYYEISSINLPLYAKDIKDLSAYF